MLDVIGPIAFCNSHLKEGATVLDLGAGQGAFGPVLAAKYGCDVICVESVQRDLDAIEGTDRVQKHHYAIGDINGPVEINLIDDHPPTGDHGTFHGRASEGVEHVQGMTLEMLLLHLETPERIELLKVDIDGGEYAMFESTDDETLSRFDQIAVLFHDVRDRNRRLELGRIARRLNGLGFTPQRFRAPKGTAHILFLNRHRIGAGLIKRAIMRTIYRAIMASRALFGRFSKR